MATSVSMTDGESRIPAWAREEWTTACLRAKVPAVALRLWYWVFAEGERQRLGGDLDAAYARHRGAVGMWRHLRGVSAPRAVVDVGVRVGLLDADRGRVLLQVLGEEPTDPDEAVAAAVAGGGLVLVEFPRQAYWEREPVDVDWGRHTASWSLLWEFARAAKAGEAVDKLTLQGGNSKDPRYLDKLKCRMVNAAGFPASLADRVVLAGRGTYLLKLAPSRIRVFERGAGDPIREWKP